MFPLSFWSYLLFPCVFFRWKARRKWILVCIFTSFLSHQIAIAIRCAMHFSIHHHDLFHLQISQLCSISSETSLCCAAEPKSIRRFTCLNLGKYLYFPGSQCIKPLKFVTSTNGESPSQLWWWRNFRPNNTYINAVNRDDGELTGKHSVGNCGWFWG